LNGRKSASTELTTAIFVSAKARSRSKSKVPVPLGIVEHPEFPEFVPSRFGWPHKRWSKRSPSLRSSQRRSACRCVQPRLSPRLWLRAIGLSATEALIRTASLNDEWFCRLVRVAAAAGTMVMVDANPKAPRQANRPTSAEFRERYTRFTL